MTERQLVFVSFVGGVGLVLAIQRMVEIWGGVQ